MSQFLFRLSPVSVSFKMEPQLGDVVVELAPEAPLVDVLPLLVDNLEGDILVMWRMQKSPSWRIKIMKMYLEKCDTFKMK